jgi:MoxR-like ATPase
MKFQGTDKYVATPDLMLAVNAAMTLKRPLLVKGEPGTGKTMLAEEAAAALGMPLLEWHIKSTTKAHQGLYEYDAVSRLRDSQLADVVGSERVKDIHNYIVKGVLWQAFTAEQPVALLIDEIDKADIEFPNDLLREIDRMEFHVYETRETGTGRWSSSPRTTRRSCPTPSCAAASSTTSSSRTPRRWPRSSTCTSRT